MHHPIQMKPADTENRNGNKCQLCYVFKKKWLNYYCINKEISENFSI